MDYKDVPKDAVDNLIWRKGVIKWCEAREDMRKEVYMACSRDILFYINTFGWTYDPRPDKVTGKRLGIIPFNTYPFQDDVLLKMKESFGKEDMLIEKSRDMGATWLNLYLIDHEWKFTPELNILIASRKEQYVYLKGAEEALFSKLELIRGWQPDWLVPNIDSPKMRLINLDNNSIIVGESTTGNLGRGGRKTVIFVDELAAWEKKDGHEVSKATRDATDCRIYNSTHNGVDTAFYEASIMPEWTVFRFFWAEHPEKARGLYRVSKDGEIEIIDQKWHKKHPDYKFNHKLPWNPQGYRSPWYDHEEGRCPNKREMAQEVDMCAIGGDYQFFDLPMLDRLKLRCKAPYRVCNFSYNDMTCEPLGFDDVERGLFQMWTILKGEEPDKDGQYVVGCDIAVGTGATNSCLTVADMVTGEKVLEYANPNIMPSDFGKLAVAISLFFKGRDGSTATLIWEANGPGRLFGIAVKDTGYPNIYYRENIDTNITTDYPGWVSNPTTKLALLGEYRRALNQSEFTNRSVLAVTECGQYMMEDNSIEHRAVQRAKDQKDPSGARENHGDRVIADALTWWAMRDNAGTRSFPENEDEMVAPEGSLKQRMDEYEAEQRSNDEW